MDNTVNTLAREVEFGSLNSGKDGEDGSVSVVKTSNVFETEQFNGVLGYGFNHCLSRPHEGLPDYKCSLFYKQIQTL